MMLPVMPLEGLMPGWLALAPDTPQVRERARAGGHRTWAGTWACATGWGLVGGRSPQERRMPALRLLSSSPRRV